ncbi:hypothetical protein ACFYT3_00045 [Nocardia amikacinitolerans]|uniref:hypothetical protein n=1 Tax=Nocardia amikacinitolerans TaxID=756689 RepID=UPI0020A26DE9|nr:hypothetical protein [Nocardia amikacinitolerans]
MAQRHSVPVLLVQRSHGSGVQGGGSGQEAGDRDHRRVEGGLAGGRDPATVAPGTRTGGGRVGLAEQR